MREIRTEAWSTSRLRDQEKKNPKRLKRYNQNSKRINKRVQGPGRQVNIINQGGKNLTMSKSAVRSSKRSVQN